MNIKAASIATLLAYAGTASAGLFGPSNFDECVLDKMKGQLPGMRSTATKACERDFETSIDIGLVSFRWGDNYSSASIERNDSDFAITRAVFSFSRVPCESAKDSDYSVKAEVRFAGWVPGMAPKTSGTFDFSDATDPSTMRCMRTQEIYGKRMR